MDVELSENIAAPKTSRFNTQPPSSLPGHAGYADCQAVLETASVALQPSLAMRALAMCLPTYLHGPRFPYFFLNVWARSCCSRCICGAHQGGGRWPKGKGKNRPLAKNNQRHEDVTFSLIAGEACDASGADTRNGTMKVTLETCAAPTTCLVPRLAHGRPDRGRGQVGQHHRPGPRPSCALYSFVFAAAKSSPSLRQVRHRPGGGIPVQGHVYLDDGGSLVQEARRCTSSMPMACLIPKVGSGTSRWSSPSGLLYTLGLVIDLLSLSRFRTHRHFPPPRRRLTFKIKISEQE